MDSYLIVKTLHILSSTVLIGTGLGIAFFMLRSGSAEHLHEKLFAARTTVLADMVFTLPAVILQPLTGAWLVWHSGYDGLELWLWLSYVLFSIAGLCWLPVVWIQIQLKRMLQIAVKDNTALPARYHRLFRAWFMLGWPAFIGLVIIVFLMVVRPA